MSLTKCTRRKCLKYLGLIGIGIGFSPELFALKLKRGKKNKSHSSYIPISKKERCPVCGMFVALYQKWITQIQFEDTSFHSFDGMKCFSRFLLNPSKYNAKKSKLDIKHLLIRDFYSLDFIAPQSAVFVIGSNVYGPMGHELIPFKNRNEAEVFSRDHQGIKIIDFKQIDKNLLDLLDNSRKTVILDQ
jgi:nitrous oxide reductase accessory protein NosL